MRFLRISFLATVALLLTGVVAPRSARADIDVHVDLFHDALAPYGRWIDYPGYGGAWTPSRVGRDWRPYTEGRWVWSDHHGWIWDEDDHEPWGWATYHYGRWLFDPRYGWLWIPGNEWAPAWVSWRRGHDHIGWLPLGPRGWSGRPVHWVFVPQRDFYAPRLSRVVLAPSRNDYVYGRAPTIVRMDRREDRRWFNRGVEPRELERVIRKKAPRVRVRDVDRPQSARLVGNGKESELRVYRPDVRARAARQDGRSPQRDARRPVMQDRERPSRQEVERSARQDAKARPTRPKATQAPRAAAEPRRVPTERARPQRDARPSPATSKRGAPSEASRREAPTARPKASQKRVETRAQRRETERAAPAKIAPKGAGRPQAVSSQRDGRRREAPKQAGEQPQRRGGKPARGGPPT